MKPALGGSSKSSATAQTETAQSRQAFGPLSSLLQYFIHQPQTSSLDLLNCYCAGEFYAIFVVNLHLPATITCPALKL
jgi:hypothetical protein